MHREPGLELHHRSIFCDNLSVCIGPQNFIREELSCKCLEVERKFRFGFGYRRVHFPSTFFAKLFHFFFFAFPVEAEAFRVTQRDSNCVDFELIVNEMSSNKKKKVKIVDPKRVSCYKRGSITARGRAVTGTGKR